jgi:hypothetical protein
MCIPLVPFLRALFTPKTGNRQTRTRQGSDSHNRIGPFAGRIKAQVKIVKFEKENEEIFLNRLPIYDRGNYFSGFFLISKN